MTKQRTERGTRRSARVDLYAAGFLIPAPDAPWIACTIVDVSEHGVCLEVGDLAVAKLFGLTFTATGDVMRVCALIWRQGRADWRTLHDGERTSGRRGSKGDPAAFAAGEATV